MFLCVTLWQPQAARKSAFKKTFNFFTWLPNTRLLFFYYHFLTKSNGDVPVHLAFWGRLHSDGQNMSRDIWTSPFYFGWKWEKTTTLKPKHQHSKPGRVLLLSNYCKFTVNVFVACGENNGTDWLDCAQEFFSDLHFSRPQVLFIGPIKLGVHGISDLLQEH